EAPACAELTVALAAMRVVAADLKRLDTSHAARRTATLRVDPPPKELETKLVQSISPDGQVLDSASKDLARARQRVREARKHVMDKLGAILAKLDQTERAPDAAVTVRGGRYVIPIRSTARSRVGGIVHDESATRSTVFVEPPEIIELGNELRAAESAELREVLRVLRELTDLLRPQAATIAAAWEMCIAFDDLCARARYAVQVNGFVPEIGAHLKIRGGRHPLLLGEGRSMLRPYSSDLVIPFDLDLHSDEFTVLVSGPNTGGKTVLIKALGLLVLLTQSGIIPPLGPHSSLPIFARVFADSRRDRRHRERVAPVRCRDADADVSVAQGCAGQVIRVGDRAPAGRCPRRVGGGRARRARSRAHARSAARVGGGARAGDRGARR
ncbi:MAG: hypothetical protein DMD59_15025, partial [Gemmatimonadetes bacterium]